MRLPWFTQFDRKTFEQQGIALGLFLAKRIVEMHRGTLYINSLPEKGTEICLRLPHIEYKEDFVKMMCK